MRRLTLNWRWQPAARLGPLAVVALALLSRPGLAQVPMSPVLLLDGEGVSAAFAPTDEDFPNPERGFHIYAGSLFDGDTFDQRMAFIAKERQLRLVFARTSLPATALTASQLAAMSANFAAARNRGVKLILKFDYGNEGIEPALSQVLAHMNQLKPVLAANQDVIAFVQAGFIGAWGEWHGSKSGLDTVASKRAIKDAVLAAVPGQIFVEFRQGFVLQEDWYPTPLTATEAFSGSPKARSGLHNDCFLTGGGDSSTYRPKGTVVVDLEITKNQLQQRQYAVAHTEYVPFGGETCNDSAGARTQMRTACSGGTDESGQSGGILNEGPRYHLTHLNHNFAPEFIEQWQVEGCYPQVRRSMGYRFQLDSVRHASHVARGETVMFNVAMRNVGWSRIFSARPLVVTIVNGGAVYAAKSTLDLMRLPSQAKASTNIPITLTVPAAAPPGSYDVYLSAPDIWPTTASSAMYAVRFANADTATQAWDPRGARFSTGTKLIVQ